MKRRLFHAAPQAESGIRIQKNVAVQDPFQLPKSSPIPFLILSFLGVFGSVYGFLTMFPFVYDKRQVLGCVLLFWAVFSVLFLLPRRWLFAAVPVILIVESRIYRHWNLFLDGYMTVFNTMYQKIRHTNVCYYTITDQSDPSQAATLFFLQIFLVLILLICYFTISRPNAVLLFVTTIAMPEIGLYYGLVPNYVTMLFLIAFWVGVLSLCLAGGGRFGRRRDAAFYRIKDQYYLSARYKRRVSGQAAVWMAGLVVCLFLATQGTLAVTGYHRADRVDKLRYEIKTAISELEIVDVTGKLSQLSTTLGFRVKSETYRLGLDAELHHTNETVLTVTASQRLQSPMYLRGYVGSVYTGSGWEKLADSVYAEHPELFDENVKTMRFSQYPQSLMTYRTESVLPANEVGLLIHAASKNEFCNYLPYGVLKDPALTITDDTNFHAASNQDYSCTFRNTTSAAGSYYNPFVWMTQPLPRMSDAWTQAELDYASFANSFYTQVPDNDAMREVYRVYQSIMENYETLRLEDERYTQKNAIATTVQDIMNAIHSDASYTLSPGVTPANRDFVHYFLLENHQGYCTYFASAGVMLCRMAGIPARYVEGYVVTDQDCNDETLQPDGTYLIEVPDTRGHAWAEIYADGIGWIPIDFTPGAATRFQEETEPAVTTTTIAQTTSLSALSGSTASTMTTTQSLTALNTTTSSGNGAIGFTVNWKAVRTILLILLLLALVIAILVLRHWITTKKRRRSLESPDANAAAISAYHYLLQLLACRHIQPLNEAPLAFAKRAEQICRFLSEGELQRVAQIALEADLSDHTLARGDADAVVALARRLAIQIAKASNPLTRFRLRYLQNLLDS